MVDVVTELVHVGQKVAVLRAGRAPGGGAEGALVVAIIRPLQMHSEKGAVLRHVVMERMRMSNVPRALSATAPRRPRAS